MSTWNESANELLDSHHAPVGDRACEICDFAVSQSMATNRHDTQAPIDMVQQWIVRWNVNNVQEAPTTSLTGTARTAYDDARRTIEEWNPFLGVTVAELERRRVASFG